MSGSDSYPKHVTDYLRKLGNPYAKLQIEESAVAAPAMHADPRRAYGNPYAFAPDDDGEPMSVRAETPAARAPAPGLPRKATKAEFEATVRRILSYYIPAAEKGKLRPHHREFIARNARRSPDERGALLAQLGRYDLSDLRGMTGHFNRERDIFTIEKLADIERNIAAPRVRSTDDSEE